MRSAVAAALEIRDEAGIIRGLDRGELEVRALQSECARAATPPDVSMQRRLTARADARRQSADAEAQQDHSGAASARALAAQLAAERQRLEAGNVPYEQWSADARGTREAAGKASAELQRRSQPHPERGTAGTARRRTADDGRMVAPVPGPRRRRRTRHRPPAPGRRRRGGLARAKPAIRV